MSANCEQIQSKKSVGSKLPEQLLGQTGVWRGQKYEKIVYDGEKDCFTLRGKQTNDEVHWDGPRLFRGCKRVQEAGWR